MSLSSVGRSVLSRRTFLRGAGVAMALPLLDSMLPAGKGAAAVAAPRRIVAIETSLGILPQFFFPERPGRDYTLTPYLHKLAAVRDQFTVFSGVSHPGVTGGHLADKCFLTGAPHPDRGDFHNGISLDQFAAEQIGHHTRFPSLALTATSLCAGTLSFTRSGAAIPAEGSPNRLFRRLFVQGSPAEAAAAVEALRRDRSTLDFVADQSRRLNRALPPADRRRLDQYFTAVRDLEKRLRGAEAWEHRPRPRVTAQPPKDIEGSTQVVGKMRLLFDVIRLALETDSSRLISLSVDGSVFHGLTHHGNRPEMIAELRTKEEDQFDALRDFLRALRDTHEDGQSLLDRTMVLYGSSLGSANAHSTVNLPVLLAGGGFRHGQHLAFDQRHNYPLTNLFVSMLQRLGLETDQFSTGRGTFRGLEMV